MSFDAADDKGNQVDGDEVEDSGSEHRNDVACHILAGADVFGGHIEVVETDHTDDGGFLDDGSDFVAESRNDVFDGLWGDNFAEDGEV